MKVREWGWASHAHPSSSRQQKPKPILVLKRKNQLTIPGHVVFPFRRGFYAVHILRTAFRSCFVLGESSAGSAAAVCNVLAATYDKCALFIDIESMSCYLLPLLSSVCTAASVRYKRITCSYRSRRWFSGQPRKPLDSGTKDREKIKNKK